MMGTDAALKTPMSTPPWCFAVVALSALSGLTLIADQAVHLSATYDEVTYLKSGARWWRTGEQADVARLGTPVTFFKLQQAPTLWLLDRLGLSLWIDDPITHQESLLPFVRIGASWIWLVALLSAAFWAKKTLGDPRAMALASVLFTLEPNLMAHGSLATMELPVVASVSLMLFWFWMALETNRRRYLGLSSAMGGVAMSCKYTTILIPPILALLWAIDVDSRQPKLSILVRLARILRAVVPGMIFYGVGMIVAKPGSDRVRDNPAQPSNGFASVD